jgi:uncharacterized protein (DUF1810 family)
MPAIDLEGFLDGYRLDFDHAVSEINGGRKRSHWMWFIFPQIAGLGSSPTATTYAIRSRAEATAFLQDPTLGPAYRQLVDAVWHQVVEQGQSVRSLFGRPDDQKLISSLTLFAGVAADLGDDWTVLRANANDVLDLAAEQGLPRCTATQRFLTADAGPPRPAPSGH